MTYREWESKRFAVETEIRRLEPLVAKGEIFRNQYLLADVVDFRGKSCRRFIEDGAEEHQGVPRELAMQGFNEKWEGLCRSYQPKLANKREQWNTLEAMRPEVEANDAANKAFALDEAKAIRELERDVEAFHATVKPIVAQANAARIALDAKIYDLQQRRLALRTHCIANGLTSRRLMKH
jgi:hypothetical protein